ncbi:hypothetical protein DPMN_178829 [Dreissena polymorpha]|uniref:Uncharacterized protein n=1 Tax=Dreissena polymorpha TaxID=45954 RepID=A0A9D4EBN9_DREPO|nr:hypothetical protein DPMN_178829 [Dreissena polymorpha]
MLTKSLLLNHIFGTFVIIIDGEEHRITASATLVEALNSDGKTSAGTPSDDDGGGGAGGKAVEDDDYDDDNH